MKTTNWIIILSLMGLMALSCTEEVIVKEEVLIHDTIYVERILVDVDTITVQTIITETDTVLQIELDSIFITNTVYVTQHDTVYLYKYVHHYHDTLVTFESGRPLEVLGEWKDIIIEFSELSRYYGWDQALGGNLIIEMWTADEAPPASRSSYQYFVYDQFLIKLKESLTHDESYTPLFRELARRVLGKKYATGDSLMNPDFPWRKLKMSSSDAEKKPYLDALFTK